MEKANTGLNIKHSQLLDIFSYISYSKLCYFKDNCKNSYLLKPLLITLNKYLFNF